MENNITIIDELMANDRKNKAWAMLSTILFAVMAVLFVVFAYRHQQEKNRLLEVEVNKTDSINMLVVSLERTAAQLLEKDSIIRSFIPDNSRIAEKINAYDQQQSVFIPETEMDRAHTRDLSGSDEHSDDAAMAAPAPVAMAPSAADEIPPAPDPSYYTVYIQCEDSRLKQAEQASKILSDQDIKVPKWEKMKFSFGSEIRYFHAEDRAKSESIANILRSNGIQVRVVQVQNQTVRKKQLELWLGSKS
ncbi:MAG: hypothetical protein JNJ58_01925 [Chitinophagaceae bacterium]|nr:hypothetical protein [Chitinophagaceae bacterium]